MSPAGKKFDEEALRKKIREQLENDHSEKQQNSKDTSSVVVEKLLSSRSLIISGEINQELAEKVDDFTEE